MQLLLARIDDRIVHAQVLVGCCEPLGVRRLIVCDDQVAADAGEARFFRAAVPDSIEVEFLDVADATDRLHALLASGEIAEAMLVTAEASTMEALVEARAPISVVTLGGAHAPEGALQPWDGFSVTREDLESLARIAAAGVEVRVQRVVASEVHETDARALTALADKGQP